MRNETIGGFTFEYDEENKMYECRGDVCYDDEHDEMPEPSLWQSALKLEKKLIEKGFDAEADYSEKGWVEVHVIDIKSK